MNTLNRFSNLDNDDDYYEYNENVNSFKPMKKSSPSKFITSVQDTSSTTQEFQLTKELFPSLTKSVPTSSVSSLSFSKIITTKEGIEIPTIEEEFNNMREDCFVAIFNKKTGKLEMPKVNSKAQTEGEIQVKICEEANTILNKLNELHIRRSKEYLLTWGEEEYIRTFLSERDVESAPIFQKTS